MTTLLATRPCSRCGAEARFVCWRRTLLMVAPHRDAAAGHIHDPNCYAPTYQCPDGHTFGDPLDRVFSKPCPACGWRKLECDLCARATGGVLEPCEEIPVAKELIEAERRIAEFRAKKEEKNP